MVKGKKETEKKGRVQGRGCVWEGAKKSEGLSREGKKRQGKKKEKYFPRLRTHVQKLGKATHLRLNVNDRSIGLKGDGAEGEQ